MGYRVTIIAPWYILYGACHELHVSHGVPHGICRGTTCNSPWGAMVPWHAMAHNDSMEHHTIVFLSWGIIWYPMTRSMGYVMVCPTSGIMGYP